MMKIKYLFVILTLIILAGCSSPSHYVTNLGIKTLEVQDADPKIYSILVGRFPLQTLGLHTLVPRSTSWHIRKDGTNTLNLLLYQGTYLFSKEIRETKCIYAINGWEDIAFFAFLIPEGNYIFEYYFPTGPSYGADEKLVYSKSISVKPGKIIYMGSYRPNIVENSTTNSGQRTVSNSFLGMEMSSGYAKDIENLKKEYPGLEKKFVVENIAEKKSY